MNVMYVNNSTYSYGLYSYNRQTGAVNYGIQRKDYSAEAVSTSELKPMELSDTVTISEESIALFNELNERKALKQGNQSSSVSLMSTEQALSTLHQMSIDNGIFSSDIFDPLSGFKRLMPASQNGLSNTEKNALSIAIQYEYISNYYSADAIAKRIEDLNLSDDADKDLIFQAEKDYGAKILGQYDESIRELADGYMQTVQREFEYKGYAPYLSIGSNTSNFAQSLLGTDRNLFLETFDAARSLISDGYGGDLIEKLQNDTDYRFNIDGAQLTRKELQKVFETLASALGKIQETWNGAYSHAAMGKRHAEIYKETQKELNWLPNEARDAIMQKIRDIHMTWQNPSVLSPQMRQNVADYNRAFLRELDKQSLSEPVHQERDAEEKAIDTSKQSSEYSELKIIW